MPKDVLSERVILTEGAGDDEFLERLIAARNLTARFSFYRRGKDEATGSGAFCERLNGLKVHPDISVVGLIIVVADNDENPNESFESIRTQIRTAGDYNIPTHPREISQRATTTRGQLPRIVILMLPWDAEKGCLETLLSRGINPKYVEEKRCSEQHLGCVGAEAWPIAKRSKLFVRCLLSSVCKSEPNTPLTYAWNTQKGRPGDIFPADHQAFNQVAEFLEIMADV